MAWKSRHWRVAVGLVLVFIVAFYVATLINYIATRNLCK